MSQYGNHTMALWLYHNGIAIMAIPYYTILYYYYSTLYYTVVQRCIAPLYYMVHTMQYMNSIQNYVIIMIIVRILSYWVFQTQNTESVFVLCTSIIHVQYCIIIVQFILTVLLYMYCSLQYTLVNPCGYINHRSIIINHCRKQPGQYFCGFINHQQFKVRTSIRTYLMKLG